MQVQGAYTRVGIPLRVRAIAIVKISSNPKVMMNAVERFLGRGIDDVQQVAKETLEGNLRGVLATLTPEEVNEDRLKFAESLSQEVEHDLAKLGLHLDVLKIQHVTDDANYLASIGRGQIAQVVKEAEIAESNARNEAAKEAAAPRCAPRWPRPRPSGSWCRSATTCAGSPPSWRPRPSRRGARRAGRAGGARHRRAGAEGCAASSRRCACRATWSSRRRSARGRGPGGGGQAAPIAENGRARAESLRLVADAWKKAGRSAQDMFLINKMEEITHIVVDSVVQIKLGPVHLIDNGDGQTLPRFAAAYPNAVATVLRSLFATTGVDMTSLLTPVGASGNGAVTVSLGGGDDDGGGR